jgi:nucleoside-diphosphate-sugar epimerase
MSDYWSGKKVLVTGGSGFIGSHVVDRLLNMGAEVTASVYQDPVNLSNLDGVRDRIRMRVVDLTRLDDCMEICQGQNIVFNIAHADGSVAFKKTRPAFILRQNMLITLNMLEAASRNQVERFLVTSSAEVYPHDSPVPTAEDQAFTKSDRLADGYTWSKRMSELAARVWTHEHSLQVAIARPNNIYGPRDYFDEARGRVIPMFIKRAVEEDKPIVIWGAGDTIRTFLYVEDLAAGLLTLVEKYPECDAVNFGGDEEISLRELAELVVRLSGSKAEIICDTSKPSGAPKRTADIAKAQRILDFRPTVSLETGLARTLAAYRKQTSSRVDAASL